MNEQRIEQALRAGPPFPTRYVTGHLLLEPTNPRRAAPTRELAALAVLAVTVAVAATLLPRLVREPGTQAPATLEQLNGPIQPGPLIVPDGIRSDIERGCRQYPDMPPGATMVMLDARGGGIAHFWIYSADASRRLFDCFVADLDPVTAAVGAVAGPYGSSVGPGELEWADPQFTSVLGYAGPGIETVRIVVDNGPTVTATRNGVWFAAYWAPPVVCPFVGQSHVCPDVHYRAIGLSPSGAVVNLIDWYSPGDAPPGWTYPPQGAGR